ncbi:MAG: peptide deformylase, partial [Clostridia bacterium]|nr:peptide deformylase [Clostridia bacterium]
MIRPIVKDMMFLSQKSEKASKSDINVIKDLQDTLAANSKSCVGMAANMIGYKKRIIIVNIGMLNMIMVNPTITKKAFPFETEEGCLSLSGTR